MAIGERSSALVGDAGLVLVGLAVALPYPLTQGATAGSVMIALVIGLALGAVSTAAPPERRGLIALAVLVVGGLSMSSVDSLLAITWVGATFAGIGIGLAAGRFRRPRP